jgi:hypothetical protein
MNRPNFCSKCGTKLKDRNDLAESSWEAYDDCEKCQIRYRTIYGDAMGGSSDSTVSRPISSSNET